MRTKSTKFRVQNFRNIDDSDWIELEQVTALVGRNESGKTALLKALHKFNPATPEPYDPQKEFPRDRYTRDYVAKGSKGGDWPVCSIRFALPSELRETIASFLEGQDPPNEIICTRYYDDAFKIEYIPAITEQTLPPGPLFEALAEFASSARRLPAPDAAQEEATARQRAELIAWTTGWQDCLKATNTLHGPEGTSLLTTLRNEADSKSSPQTAEMVERFQAFLAPILEAAGKEPVIPRMDRLVDDNLPVFIFFENYGILDSAVWLPRFIEDLNHEQSDPRIRTINAMFKHVGLDAKEIANLGAEQAWSARQPGQAQPNSQQIAAAQRQKEERSIRLNSASIDISKRFSAWWSQRRHQIRYHADGDYFRIWIADDRRPDVEIELEARSKGFQWFFSFYLVFLVESEGGHRDAVLLLDEPGLDLHPTAQQELIAFFEKLSEENQIIYTTHSPFLIDGDHLHRVRPVIEDKTGHSRISAETWPEDRETIFPLWAAAGYAMVRGLFRHRKNVLVEGMSDYYYLYALSPQCQKTGRTALPDDVYVTACGGTKLVGQFASLFLGQRVRPLVLLDGDDAGRVRRDALMKELYVAHRSEIIMLDDALGRAGAEVEIEDILGESIVLPAVEGFLGRSLPLTDADRRVGSLPSQIKAAAKRQGVELPEGWKASVAINLVSSWAEKKVTLPDTVLEAGAKLFIQIRERFDAAASAPAGRA